MTQANSDTSLLMEIFFPGMKEDIGRVQGNGGRFVYYTSAETAFKILKNREIWMRNTRTMNDYMEVDHGLECLIEAFKAPVAKAFKDALNNLFPGIADEIVNLFNQWIPHIQGNTFVTCVSEHLQKEDQHGRLSMWRAYGGSAGVALIVNGKVMLQETDALAAYTIPVAYRESADVGAELECVANSITKHRDYILERGQERLKAGVFRMLYYTAVCTKHPGFQEEREWRVVATPEIKSSDLLPCHVEVVQGIPQVVLKIKFQDHQDRGLYGLELPQLLNRIIIGPCDYPDVIFRALHKLLVDANIPDPESKIVVSQIPLRLIHE